MAKETDSPAVKKSKLITQLKELEKKISDFDNARATKIGALAKKYKLTDLSDSTIEQEFKAIRDKHKTTLNYKMENVDTGKKKS